MSKFKRPENLTFPHTYYTFKAKDKNSDNVIEYRVQDLPESYYEEAIDFMVKYFLPDETFCSSRNIINKPNAIESFCSFWYDTLKHKLSIACFRNDGSEELVGANVLTVVSRDDPEDDDLSELKDQDVIDVFSALIYTTKQFDVLESYNVDKYLTAYGLCVNPAYRGRGIATEMLKARVPIMKALGLQVTSTLFTGIGSQTAARKADYEERFVLSLADIQEKLPRFDFSKSITKEVKTMVLTV